MQNTRTEAIFILSRWLISRDFPDRLLASGPDRPFIMDMVYTTIRRYATLNWALEKFLTKTPGGETLAALLLGTAQILFMEDVADHAAVNETVAAAKARSPKSAPLVNAILRSVARSRTEILEELQTQPLHIRASHPEELVRRWNARFSAEQTEMLCEWNNTPAETVVTRRPGADGISRFETVPRGTRVQEIPGYAEGAFIVQDPATAPAIALLDLQPGLSILDGCAAPGGKTVQIAWRATDSRIVALDLHQDRLETLRENLRRVRLDNVAAEQGDLTQSTEALKARHGLFDRILLDVPCSNTGVLRRRPDARWRWSERRMHKLVQQQRRILANAAKLLSDGGTLVYSTCSLEPEENTMVVEAFVRTNPQFTITGSAERIPWRDHTDGAFACALRSLL
jgi:16S rRNA (cytosine967-C5)-methyltransferase